MSFLSKIFGKKESMMLGNIVKDIYTDLQGLASSRVVHLYGCIRIGIIPKGLKDDGTPLPGEWVDEQRVETIEETGGKYGACNDAQDSPIPLGSQVYDSLSDLKGTAVSYLISIDGPPKIAIQPRKLHNGEIVDSHWVPIQRVMLMEEKAPVVSRESKADSGGMFNEPSI